jgi:hypothetical protein
MDADLLLAVVALAAAGAGIVASAFGLRSHLTGGRRLGVTDTTPVTRKARREDAWARRSGRWAA